MIHMIAAIKLSLTEGKKGTQDSQLGVLYAASLALRLVTLKVI